MTRSKIRNKEPCAALRRARKPASHKNSSAFSSSRAPSAWNARRSYCVVGSAWTARIASIAARWISCRRGRGSVSALASATRAWRKRMAASVDRCTISSSSSSRRSRCRSASDWPSTLTAMSLSTSSPRRLSVWAQVLAVGDSRLRRAWMTDCTRCGARSGGLSPSVPVDSTICSRMKGTPSARSTTLSTSAAGGSIRGHSATASSRIVSRGRTSRRTMMAPMRSTCSTASGRPVSNNAHGVVLSSASSRRQSRLSRSTTCRSSITIRPACLRPAALSVASSDRAIWVWVGLPAPAGACGLLASMTVAMGSVPGSLMPIALSAATMSSSVAPSGTASASIRSARTAAKGVVRFCASPSKARTVWPSARASSIATAASRLLPMPGGPITAAACRSPVRRTIEFAQPGPFGLSPYERAAI